MYKSNGTCLQKFRSNNKGTKEGNNRRSSVYNITIHGCVVIRLCPVSETVIARFYFSVPMEVSVFVNKTCVGNGDATIVVFNIEAGNYYSKSTFIMTLIKQEKLVFISVILYIWEYLFGSIYCYSKIVYG